MGGVSIKNTRILMLLMILTIAMITLGSVSASDIDTNQSLSMAEIDTIDISQENIKINENDIVTDTPVGVSLDDDDVLSASGYTIREKETQSEDSVDINPGDSLVIQIYSTGSSSYPTITYTNLDTGTSYTYNNLRVVANYWYDYPAYTFSEAGTYSVVVTYSSWNWESNTLTVNVGSSSPYTLTIYDENNPDETTIKYNGENSVTLNLHSTFTSTEQSASQLQSLVGSTRPVIYVDGVAKGNGNLGYEGITSTADSITLTKGQHTIYYVLPANDDIDEIKSNELTVYVNLGDYYLRIYEEDGPDNTTFYYDGIYNFNLYNKLYNTLGLSGTEVKNSLYQSGDGYYNPVTYYVNGNQISDSRTGYGYRPSVWVDGTSEASAYSNYPNYIQWAPDSTGVYEIYAEYSATSSLGTIRSDTITIYVGVEPPAEDEDTSLTLSSSSKINTTESITITPTVLDSQNNPVTTGSITYTEGNNVLATKTYDEGWALTIDSSTAGEHVINAVFTADGYVLSDNSATYLALTPTTVDLTLNRTDVGAGEVISITPTVSDGSVTSGNVYIYDENDNNIGSTAPGVAFEYTVPESTSIGSYSFYAVYQEDLTGYHASSRSTNKEYKVKGYVTINIDLNGENDVTVGTSNARNIVFTVTGDVAVEVKVSQDHIGDQVYDLDNYTIDVTNGVNTDTFNFASDLGISHIYAEFSGNDQYFASRSNNVTLNVLQSVTPTVRVDLNVTQFTVGDYVLITPTVTYNNENVNVGTITLYRRYNYANQETIATINVGETATYQIPSTEIASVYATYNGNAYDENYYYNSANGYKEVSVLNSNSISLSADTPVYVDSTVTLTATLSNAYKYYDYIIVHFYDGETDLGYGSVYSSGTQSNIVLTKDVTFTTLGIHNITAHYAGDSKYTACNSDIFEINVIPCDTAITLDISPDDIMVDTTITITPTVTFGTDGVVDEGTVSYSYINGTPIDTLDINTPLTLSNLKAGQYEVTAKYNGADKYNPTTTNATIPFTVRRYDIELSISVDDATYPNAPEAVITTNVAGDYVVYINGKKYDLTFTEEELSGSKTVTGEVTAVGTDYSANVSISASNRYNAVNDSDSFNVNEGTNNAALVIASETTLPDKVTITVNNAVAGDYVVSFNDSSIADVVLTVGDSGSASEDVYIPAGSYKATLAWTNANYSDVSQDIDFTVVKGITTVSASANETLPITYGDKIAVKGTSDVSGTIKVYENDKEIASGNANEWIELPSLSADTHTLKLELINDDYETTSDTIEIAVNTAEIELSIEVQNKVYPKEVTGTVRANVPGTYTVKLDGETKTTVVIDETGFSTFSFGVLDVKNNYNASVSIDAIGNYSAAYDSKLFDVTVDGTTLTISSSTNDVDYGTAISFTHEINPATATGTIQFYYASNNTNIGNPINVGETLENVILPAGTHQIAAKYISDDDNYYDATSDPITVTINALSNPVVFDVAQNTVYDNKVVFTITNAIEGTYTIKFNVSTIPDLTLTVNSGETSASDSILIPAGSYDSTLIWKADNYDDVNIEKAFTVSKGTNAVTVSSDGADYPGEVTINVVADLAGDYVVVLNDTANTQVTVNVGSSGSGSKSVKLAAGSYKATTVSNPDGDNYELSVSDATFTVNKGTNNAELAIASETTLPDKVTIAVNNAVAGDYVVSFNDSAVASVTLTVGDSGSASSDVAIPAGSYKANLSWSNANYTDVNKDQSFAVVKSTNTVTVSSDGADYPGEVTINVVADLAGDYVVVLNDTANTQVTVNVGSSGSGSKSVKLPVGSYKATTVSNPDEDNYDLVVTDATFTVNKGTNNAELSIASETTLPDKVTISISNAVAGDYVVRLNDTANTEVILTVGDSGSASKSVDLPVGSYKATLSWTNDNYSDVNKEANFKVLEEQKLLVIWDNQHSQGQDKISCDEEYEISSIYYTIDTSIYNNFATMAIYVDDELYYGPTYGNGQSYYIYLYNNKLKFDKAGSHNIKLLYSSDKEYWSNVLVYEVSAAEKYETNLTVSDYDTGATGIVNKFIGDISILINLSSVELGNSISNYFETNSSGGIEDYVTLYQITSSGSHKLGTLKLNENGLANAIIPVSSEGWYNFTVSYDGNSKGLQSSNSKIISYHVTEEETILDIIKVVMQNADYPNNATGTVYASENGIYIVNVNNKDYEVNVTDGSKDFTVDVLDADTYDVTVTSKDYPNNSNSSTLTVNKGTATITVSVDEVTYPEEVNIIVESTIDDTFTVMVNTTPVSVEVKDGRGNKTVRLDAGIYDAKISYTNDNYDLTINNTTFKVNQGEITLSIDIPNVNHSVNVTGTVYASVDGNYNVTIGDNDPIFVYVNGGSGAFDAGKLAIGNYSATVAFIGNTNYEANSNGTDFNVSLDVTEFSIAASPNVINYTDSAEIVYSLPEGVTGTIEFTYGNVTKTINVGDKLVLDNLDADTYTIVAKYSGNSPNATAQTTLTVNPVKKSAKVIVDDVTYPEKVTVIVEADIDGVYTVDVNGNKVSVNVVGGKGNNTINLPAGEYETKTSFNNTNYDLTISEDGFKVSPEVSSAVIKIRDRNYPNNDTIYLKTGELAIIEYILNDTSSYSYFSKLELYMNGVNTGKSISMTDIVWGSYSYFIDFTSTEANTYTVNLIHSYEMMSSDNHTSNTITYVFTKSEEENITNESYATELSLVDVYNSGNIIKLNVGDNISIAAVLSGDALGDSISDFVASDETISLYAYNEDTGKFDIFMGKLPVNYISTESRKGLTARITESGWFNFTAVYEGNSKLNGSTSNILAYYFADNNQSDDNVSDENLSDSSISIEVSSVSVVVGENITVDYVVSDGAKGNITFFDGSDAIGTVNVGDKFVINNLTEGIHSIYAKYNGDDKFNVYTSNTVSVKVKSKDNESDENKTYATELSLIDVYNAGNIIHLNIGDNIGIAAVLDDSISGFVGSDETISLYAYNEDTGKFDILMGKLPINFNSTTYKRGLTAIINEAGWYNFTAVYEGNAILNSSISNILAYYFADNNQSDDNVSDENLSDSSISIEVSSVSVVVGENITVDYVVSDGAKGNITFFDGSDAIGTVNVGDKFVINNLTEGIHFITAIYNGDDKFNVSSSNVVAVEVKSKGNESDENITNKTTPEMNINSPESITEGENATVTVTLPADAAGNVTIGDEVVPVVNGTASATVSGLSTGNNTISVVYSGDDKYNPVETSVNVTVDKKETPKENATISIDAPGITEGENATVTVTLPADAAGNVTIGDEVVPVVNGTASATVSGLPAGNNTISVVYSGDDKYNPVETSVNVTVDKKETPKENATINMTSPEVNEGDNATITISLPEDATGNVTATVDGVNYTAPVVNGTATISIPDLDAGNHSIPVTYSGDDKYNPIESVANVTVDEDTSEIVSAPDLVKYFHGAEKFIVNVTDNKGNPIENKSVVININGVPYTRTTNASGIASIAINLGVGVYNVTSTVDNKTVESVITVLTTVNGTDLTKVYKNESQYYVTLRDTQGNYLAEGSQVQFNINGVMYYRYVSGNEGLARLNINLNAGEYIITAINLETGEMSSNNITVLPRLVENHDVTKYYRNATQYTVKVIGDDGNPVGAGEVVTFNINGVFYNRTTDENGIAKLNINLSPGDYIITAMYKGFMVSNNIKVLPTLTANDLTKTYGTSDQFVAHLVDDQGNPFSGQNISFNINGVFYERTTDADGNAKLNINLGPGEYIITSKYEYAVIGNTVKVNA